MTDRTFFARKNRRLSLIALAALPAWAPSISITSGTIYSTANGTAAVKAQSTGTSGTTPPAPQGLSSDGSISYVSVDIASLARQ
jgi:hypothetical protein